VNNRPISPHLQIYKPQITSILSILHRMTGLFLSLGFIVLAFWLASVILGDEYYYGFLSFFKGWLGKTLLLGWTWSLFFHISTGIRHLFWDAGYGYAIKTLTLSGWLAVAASLVLTAASWWIACACTCMKALP
jgi:succinate dehydrogenase / fumarate reductase cytochrome b subunit